jgi:DNA-binding FadR family transcriptional regulator
MGLVDQNMFLSVGSEASLVQRVANELQRLVLDGHLIPGTQLPSQIELAEQMGVSRTVIREAVGVLVTKGLLETRHGVGTIVCELTRDQVVQPLNLLLQKMGITLDQLHQVRVLIETEVAGLAATQAKEEDLQGLIKVTDEMKARVKNPTEYTRLDNEFHQTLARIAGNPLLVVLSDSMRDLLLEVRLAVSTHPDVVTITMPDHVRIVEELRAKNVVGARQAMVIHLKHALDIQKKVLATKEKNATKQ